MCFKQVFHGIQAGLRNVFMEVGGESSKVRLKRLQNEHDWCFALACRITYGAGARG